MAQHLSRGEFLKRIGGLSALVLIDPSAGVFAVDALKHPEPRAGVTADKVLRVEDLGEKPRKAVLDAYDAARRNPEVFDGLACGCGCHGEANYQHRSLLSCYETRQPTGCPSCRDEATFVGGMIRDGKALAEIRLAVDKKFGE